MSPTMGPEHVPRHGPRPHPTTWAPDTSHNMGPPISHSTAASLHRHPNPQLPYPTATPFTRSASLFDCFLHDEVRPDAFTPLVAIEWEELSYTIFGNRRLYAVKEYARIHGPWNSRAPEMRIIVHKFPFEHLVPVGGVELRYAFLLKALDAMSSRYGVIDSGFQLCCASSQTFFSRQKQA